MCWIEISQVCHLQLREQEGMVFSPGHFYCKGDFLEGDLVGFVFLPLLTQPFLPPALFPYTVEALFLVHCFCIRQLRHQTALCIY